MKKIPQFVFLLILFLLCLQRNFLDAMEPCRHNYGNNDYFSEHSGGWHSCLHCKTFKTAKYCYLCCMPVNVTADASSKTIKVSWRIPEPPKYSPWLDRLWGPLNSITHYSVKLSSDETMCQWTKNTTETSTLLSNLTPSVMYNITVKVFNENKAGAVSPVLRIQTDAEVPSLPPEELKVYLASSTSVLVEWKPPLKHGCHGNITHYLVQWTTTNPRAYYGIETQNTSHLFSGLSGDTKYNVTVQAFNKAGGGPKSWEVQAHTTNDDYADSISEYCSNINMIIVIILIISVLVNALLVVLLKNKPKHVQGCTRFAKRKDSHASACDHLMDSEKGVETTSV